MTIVQLAAQRTFRSLRIRNFRLFFFGQLVSVTGTWMQQVAQDWLVLRLTDEALPLGITTALQFLPYMFLGTWGGLIADRFDKRRVLIATQGTMALLAIALGVLVATGSVQLWMVYVMALALGCATSFDMPARQAFVGEMVGPDQVVNAVGLNSAVFNSARIVGPAVAGGLIGVVGLAPAFLINGASYLAVIGGLARMDASRLHQLPPAQRARGQAREAFRYVMARPALRTALLMVLLIGTLGFNFRTVLPLLVRFTFEGSAAAYGALASIMAAGSVLGALTTASRRRPTRAYLFGTAAAFGVLALAAAAAPAIGWAALVLPFIGFCSISFMTTANTTLQLGSDASVRGRVMSLYGLVFFGTAPVGALLVGWMAEQFGARSGLVLAGVSTLATVALLFGWRRRGEPAEQAPSPEPSPEPAATAPSGPRPAASPSGPVAGRASERAAAAGTRWSSGT